jgi:hypothetical protein
VGNVAVRTNYIRVHAQIIPQGTLLLKLPQGVTLFKPYPSLRLGASILYVCQTTCHQHLSIQTHTPLYIIHTHFQAFATLFYAPFLPVRTSLYVAIFLALNTARFTESILACVVRAWGI